MKERTLLPNGLIGMPPIHLPAARIVAEENSSQQTPKPARSTEPPPNQEHTNRKFA